MPKRHTYIRRYIRRGATDTNESITSISRDEFTKDEWGTAKPLCYWPFYEGAFFDKRLDPINLIEIGIFKGQSLKIWKRYFKNANKIIGIDIMQYDYTPREMDGVDIVEGDATDKSIFDKYNFKELKYDFIIDDGSHRWHHIIASFKLFYPLLKPGGFYIIEDVCASAERYILRDKYTAKNNPTIVNWRGLKDGYEPEDARNKNLYNALMLYKK